MPDEPVGQEASAGAASATPAADTSPTPSADPIALSDDSMVRIPGQDKPVKWQEWYRGLQSNHTRATQERAAAQKELDSLKSWRQQAEAELQRYRSVHQPQNQPDPRQERNKSFQQLMNKLRTTPYTKGSEMAELAEALREEVSGVGGGAQKQLVALRLMAQEFVNMKRQVAELSKQSTESSHRARLEKVRTELGIPEDLTEWMDDIYRAYEPGEALDREYPNLVKSRWDAIQSAVDAARRAKVEAARQSLRLPGKGGAGTPSEPLDMGSKSPKEIADLLHPFVTGSKDSKT